MIGLLSHPDKFLIDHLREVASIATRVVSNNGYRFVLGNGAVISQQQLTDMMWIAGAFHDLAKATSYFQDYIKDPKGVHSKLKNHALLSALFSYYVATKYCSSNIEDDLLRNLLPIFVFTAVKRHHGSIINLADEILFKEDEYDLMTIQIRSIDESSIDNIINKLYGSMTIPITWNDFIYFFNNRLFDKILENFGFDTLDDTYLKLDEPTRICLFNLFQVIYSALMYADKNDVILDETIFKPTQTNITNLLNQFREKKGFNKARTEIDRLKNDAYFKTLEHLGKVYKQEKHLYSITLPTGLGKTLTAYAVADKLRQLSGNVDAKILINIPFTSIIDQNFDVYQQVLGTDSSDILLKHHHLAEPNYKDSSERIYDSDKSQFLIETWQSETIVTTFVQFLETILSMDKTKLMKLANLRNAVVLLDEIQTIPYELWETIRKSFISLGESLNMYFILISATQPLIFTPGEEIVELVPDHKRYFKAFNRTRILYHPEPISIDSFIEIVANYITERRNEDVLVILNTKRAARYCFEQLVKINFEDNEYYFLSTLITPYERKEIISKIKKKNGMRKLIISTQLIEAGVDISVDTIFRQFSPVDSIIQSTGRANRYNEKDVISNIYIYEINGQYQKITSRLYGADLILKSRNVLSKFYQVEESNYLNLINEYFIEVRKQSDNTSSYILNAILGLRFNEIDLKLIEEIKTESVFIQLDDRAVLVWENYVELINTNGLSPWELKSRFAKFKAEFYEYVINVPIPYNELNINFDSEKLFGFYVSKKDKPSQFYFYSPLNSKLNTGYKNYESIFL